MQHKIVHTLIQMAIQLEAVIWCGGGGGGNDCGGGDDDDGGGGGGDIDNGFHSYAWMHQIYRY